MNSSPDVIGSSRKALPTLQHLSPPLARFFLGIERLSCRELGLVKGTRLLLALSGGADSTALAMVFFLLASRLALNLSALCVDHSLRPDSGEDACHVQDFCKSLDIPCSVQRIDVAAYAAKYRMGLEEAGRHSRYALLEKERMHLNADWILLGHHAGDLSEDIMLRLIRGTGWPGLAGMTYKDSARRLFRPFLFTEPQVLREFLRKLGVPWREDASNSSLDFRRNRLRHKVLPLLLNENPALNRCMGTLQRLGRLDDAYWEEMLDKALKDEPWQEARENDATTILLPKALLRSLHPAARLRLYVRAFRELGPQNARKIHGQPRASTLLALDEALCEGRGNTRFQLPGGIEAKVRKGCIQFERMNQPSFSNESAAAVIPSASSP